MSGFLGGQEVVGAGKIGIGGDADIVSGGGTGGGGGGDKRSVIVNRQLIRWEVTVTNLLLGTGPNVPLAYDLGLELSHPIMSILGGHRG